MIHTDIDKIFNILHWNVSEEFSQGYSEGLVEQFKTILCQQQKQARFQTDQVSCLEPDQLLDPRVSRFLLIPGTKSPSKVSKGALTYNDQSLEIVNFDARKFDEVFVKPSCARVNLDDQEFMYATSKIEKALNLLRDYCPSSFPFVDRLTFYIELWKELGLGGGSTSTGDWLGRTILRNPHREDFDVVLISECLVHEAIHHALNIIEFKHPIIIDPKVHGRKIVSRWSGNFIGAHANIHACFVWYGLYWFYDQLRKESNLNSSMLLQRQAYTARGFRSMTSIVQHYASINDMVNRDYLLAAELMQREILNHYDILEHNKVFSRKTNGCDRSVNDDEANIYTA